ncbi:MAG TPA: zinc-binding dehydrogenase [Salinimicrobium sp.]|nr:zinc-binding dehydrogenase [Salinimicrobium sp.]
MISSRRLQEMPPLPTKKNCREAVVISSPEKFEIVETELPQPNEGEVRIKLEGSGINTSNLPIWEGRDSFSYPMLAGEPGREGWGTIDAIGKNVEDFEEGDIVTCLSNHGFATHDIARAENVIKLPDPISTEPFPGEALGGSMNVFNRSNIQPNQTIAIVGCGFLGLLLVQLTKSAGANVIAISKRDFSLEIAKKSGADYCIKLEDHNQIIEKVNELTNGKFCDRVIETTAKELPLNLSVELTAERGKLIVAGFHQEGIRNENIQNLINHRIDMVSIHADPKEYIKGIKDAILAIEKGLMNPYPLFTHSFSLHEIDEAFQYLKNRPDGFIKALILNT